MKKLFATFSVVVLLGAGCLGGGGGSFLGGGDKVDENLITGDWWLVFDLPENWTPYAYYQSGEADPGEITITRELNDIVVQSTPAPIADETDVTEGAEGFATSDYTHIRVFRYDPRTNIPADADDLGNGFFKRTRDDGSISYHFKGTNGNYKFLVEQNGRALSEAEAVIMSAKEVTAL